MADPALHSTAARQDRFAVLKGTVDEMETLHLGARHRRALFKRGDDGFTGQWIAP